MWIIVLILAVLAGVLCLGAFAALIWLGRALQWSELDDDHPDVPSPVRHPRFGWLTGWARPKHGLLTYRRDERGRFRRHRR